MRKCANCICLVAKRNYSIGTYAFIEVDIITHSTGFGFTEREA